MAKRIGHEFDMNADGKITETETKTVETLIRLENMDKKEDQLRQMAWVAMLSMVIYTLILFLPIIPVDRVLALDNIMSMFYIAQAGTVASFFGVSAYINRNVDRNRRVEHSEEE